MNESDKLDEDLDALLRIEPSYTDGEMFVDQVARMILYTDVTRQVILIAGWCAGIVLCYLVVPEVTIVLRAFQALLTGMFGQSTSANVLIVSLPVILLILMTILPRFLFGRRQY